MQRTALQELDCAKGVAKKQKATLRDFIIPLKIDDLPRRFLAVRSIPVFSS
jgi:hypothetical protein